MRGGGLYEVDLVAPGSDGEVEKGLPRLLRRTEGLWVRG